MDEAVEILGLKERSRAEKPVVPALHGTRSGTRPSAHTLPWTRAVG
ncbi:hypothetical protein JK361_18645 [Streptomyces sp. 5-8]|uniref:Uncharacterized protein n=1 Tax=Streptomyces musisoli TaxID=2802280 RepID=A0ABS1P2J5_9ACTN|nr:hypothetical protein [Streptomyces musisoli]